MKHPNRDWVFSIKLSRGLALLLVLIGFLAIAASMSGSLEFKADISSRTKVEAKVR